MILDGKAESVGAERMRKWFHEATDDCDLVASFKLGICLAKQSIKSHSRYDSVDLCRLANDGVSVAQYRYGRMLIESRGPDMNPIAGRVWIARAAESDAVDAIVYLGYLQLTGIAGEKDHLASHALFKRAAEKGHIGAMVALATLYCGGNGVPTDRNFAKHWFHNAAARGSRTARLMLMRHFSPFSADNVIRCQGLSDAAPAHLNG
jgi:TPR repeat protein